MYQLNQPIFTRTSLASAGLLAVGETETANTASVAVRNESRQPTATIAVPAGHENGSYFRYSQGAVSGNVVKQTKGVLVLVKNL
jgi:hypothetical protein